MPENKDQGVTAELEKLIQLRHWLHANPELSRQENETAKYMRAFLEENAKPDRIVSLYGAGFAAVYDGIGRDKTIMLRCELDALPIHDTNTDLPYRSKFDGVGHKCGHDGHMTILAGVAQCLAHQPAKGRVVLLFQPDEETGTGARGCCAHPNFPQIEPDLVFALHNLPGFSQGEVICRKGTFASKVRYAAIKFMGREAHSAQPETGANPSFAMAELALKSRDIQAKYDQPNNYALVVPVYTHLGVQASGVSPAKGEAHFTLRASHDSTVQAMWDDLWDNAQSLAERDGLHVGFEIQEEFAATINSQTATQMIKQAAEETGLLYRDKEHAFRWGEDFGEFTKRYEGGMFGLGAGLNRPDLHNADYDFPDKILESGISMFTKLIEISFSDK